MKKTILFFIIHFIISLSIFSIDISDESLSLQLKKGGEDRIKAIWISYETKKFYLFRKSLEYLLLEENNDLEAKIILRIFNLLDKDLESIIPNWYIYIDQYVNEKRPVENLLECLKLAQRWKEIRLIFAILKLTKHPLYEIRHYSISILRELQSDMVLPVIIEFLKSKNELLILYGLENSIKYPDSRLIPFIRNLINHNNKTIRIYALKSLSNYDVESQHVIKNFDNENDEVIQTILWIIGEKKWYNYINLIYKGITYPNPEIRKSAIEAAVKLKNLSFVNIISKQLLIETDSGVIIEGIKALTELKQGDPFNALIFLSNHTEPEIRLASIKAIQILKLSNYFHDLIDLLNKEKHSTIHLELIYTICTLIDSKNYHSVIDILENSQMNPLITKEEKYLLLSAIEKFIDQNRLSILMNRIEKY